MIPLVTVVIAAYNRSHLLSYAIKSVLNQDFQDFEIQVVGDCCSDDSEQIVRSFNDQRIHWTNLNRRIGTQSGPNNEGIRRAQGQFIAYLGQDDLWFPWHLSNLVELLKNGIDFGITLSAWVYPGGKVQIGDRQPKQRYGLVLPGSWMHKLSIIPTTGLWREDPLNLDAQVDTEFGRRILEHGFSYGETKELSIIKFPSPEWNTYSAAQFPQEEMFKELRKDPYTLHYSLLKKIALEASQKLHAMPLRYAILEKGLKIMGEKRWITKKIRTIQNRKYIQETKKKRGLIQSQSQDHSEEKELLVGKTSLL